MLCWIREAKFRLFARPYPYDDFVFSYNRVSVNKVFGAQKENGVVQTVQEAFQEPANARRVGGACYFPLYCLATIIVVVR